MKVVCALSLVIAASGCAQTRTPGPVVYPDACGSHVECFTRSLENLDEAYRRLDDARALATRLTPPGTVAAYAGTQPPEGWLVCDGRSLDKNDPRYKPLFDAIGTTHGGDANPGFQLPDYRGRFLRGVDLGAGRDPDAAARTAPGSGATGNQGDQVGSLQGDSLGSHAHAIQGWHLEASGGSGFDGAGFETNSNRNHPSSHDYGTRGAGGSETRPKNAAVLWIIKL